MVFASLAGFCIASQLPSLARSSAPDSTPDRKSLGDAGAPIEIVAYADFQCAPCAQFALVVKPELVSEYVRSGKARLTYRHLTVLGDLSLRAALAAEAAGEQDAFWPYHDRLFELQSTEGRGAFTNERLRTIAAGLGLDLALWEATRGSPAALERVQNETKQAEQLGIRETPTLLVAGQRVEGAQPYAVLRQLIEQRLRAAGE